MQSTHTRRGQRGLTMVESLVALVVLSTGMLGIAGLYVTSLKAERNALSRTHAVYLVNDIIDRIRANAPARSAYNTASYTGGPQDKGCVAGTTNCSSAALAEDDLYHWIEEVKTALPNYKSATVEFTPAASPGQPDNFRVRLEWVDAGDGSQQSAPSSLETNVQIIPVKP